MTRLLFILRTLPMRLAMEWRLRARRKSRECIRKYRAPGDGISERSNPKPMKEA